MPELFWSHGCHTSAPGHSGWNGSHLACQRLKEAVTEIKLIARIDPVTASGGVVSLMERIWPAVNWTQDELLPIMAQAPADSKTRKKWLDRGGRAMMPAAAFSGG